MAENIIKFEIEKKHFYIQLREIICLFKISEILNRTVVRKIMKLPLPSMGEGRGEGEVKANCNKSK